MLINLRNALMAGKRLPYDAELEYIESTGTQWIDTGIISDGTGLTVEVICSKTTSATKEMAIVGRSGHDGFDLYALNSKFELWNSSGIVAKNPTTISAGEVYDVIGSTTGNEVNLSINGVNSSRPGLISFQNENIVLFRHNSKYYWVGRLMFCKIWQNGVLVRDFIPVRKGTTGELYDRVSGKFAERHGDFLYGADVVPVEYIESHGTEWIDTGVKADLPLQLEADIDFTNPNTGTNVQCLCGGYRGPDRFWIASLPQGKLNCGLTNNAISAANVPVGQKASLNVVFENGRQTGTIDGVQFVSASNTTSNYWFRDYNLRIFHMFGPFIGNNDRPLQAKLYGCRLFINSSAPVRSFRPVRVGTDATSWEGATMDVLTRRIYRNAGTGAFAYGNDLRYPIPSE